MSTTQTSTTRGSSTPLAQLLSGLHGRIRLAVGCQVLASALGLVPLIAITRLAGAFLDPQPVQAGTVWLLVGVGLVGALLALAAGFAAVVLSHLADNDMQLGVRRKLAARLGRVPLGWFGRGSGVVGRALRDDVEAVHALVAHSLLDLATVITVPVVTLVYLFATDWRLTLVSIGTVLIGIVLFRVAMAGSTKQMGALVRAMNDINSGVVEFVDGIAAVKLFGRHRQAHQRFTRAADGFAEFFTSWVRATLWPSTLSFLVLSPAVVTVVVVALGAVFMRLGWSGPSAVVTFAVLASALAAPMNVIGSRMQQLTAARAAAGRVAALLEEPELPAGQDTTTSGGEVVFDGVSFRYPGTEVDVLRDVNLVLAKGTVTALVGPSGAGKSTLAALLVRFYDVTTGSVRIGGVDIKDIEAEHLYRQVGFVLQDVRLLRESIADNIALARPDASRADIERAARAARIHETIAGLPRGYDSVVGEDVTLSGGQAQRVSIARALLADTPVLVLDEATSFTDPESESAIQEALAELVAGRTVLVIAHRLAAITEVDQIIVLDSGRIVERGRHPQLLEADGRYAQLWAAQRDRETEALASE
jgi:ATP-binding cassette subfamily B protein IrtA